MIPRLASIPELAGLRGYVSLAIGVFDGVHLGHRAVLDNARSDAQANGGVAAALTFDPHPLRVLAPDRAPRLLTAKDHKVRIIRSLGIDQVGVADFNRAFASLDPRAFVEQLREAVPSLGSVSVGPDWAFGKGRAGDVELLRTLGEQNGFKVIAAEPVLIDGELVSSTRIRKLIEAGDLDQAGKLLGRPYGVMGTVRRGEQLGTKLGYPTANLSAHNEQFPPDGVYVVKVIHSGTTYGGVANIGWRPTVPQADPERLLEVHVFDLEEDLYDQDIEAIFLEKIRPEKRFESLEDLRAQIAEDAVMARSLLKRRA